MMIIFEALFLGFVRPLIPIFMWINFVVLIISIVKILRDTTKSNWWILVDIILFLIVQNICMALTHLYNVILIFALVAMVSLFWAVKEV